MRHFLCAQPGRVENGDDGHPIADFAMGDHLHHFVKGKNSHLEKFGVVGRQGSAGQIVAQIEMGCLVADALGCVIGADRDETFR